MTISVRPLLAYLSLALGAPATAGHGAPATARVHTHALDYEPRVRVWLTGDNVFQHGERARVFFRTEEDAYVMLVRLDTDGQLHVLFPDDPDDDGFVRGGITYRGSDHGLESFYVDDYPGMGYVFAIAAERPLDLGQLGEGRRWDYRAIGGRVVRDPVVAMQGLAERLLDEPEEPYGLDYSEYYVDRRVEYPRFLCYDCHSYRPYPVWDPYEHVCTRYRVVVYDEPEVYRYRYSPGSRVVYAQTPPRPRYEFKLAPRGSSVTPDNFIERRRRADRDDYRRRDARPGERGGIDRRRRDEDRDDARRRVVEPSDDERRENERRVAPPPRSDEDDSPPDAAPPPSRRGRRPPV
jgi:Domain of unknown function (DUF4384)